ncbi:hypothetical protein [Cytobacillus oceanisediminis]|nr:hypothetical protein [Cytobacillus oceanisediminis]MCM3393132.1 hypothetical protein [Cytobacillus oceanisediminis]
MKKLLTIFNVLLFLSFGSVISYETKEIITAEDVTELTDPIRPPVQES